MAVDDRRNGETVTTARAVSGRYRGASSRRRATTRRQQTAREYMPYTSSVKKGDRWQPNYEFIRGIVDSRMSRTLVTDAEIASFTQMINDEYEIQHAQSPIIAQEVHRLIDMKKMYHVPRIGRLPEDKPHGVFRFMSCQFNSLSTPSVRARKVALVQRLVNEFEINAVCGSELGVNFSNVDASNSLASWFERDSPYPVQSVTSHNIHSPGQSRHLQGGTGIVLFHELIQYAKKKCPDFRRLGRYCSWVLQISPTHRFRLVVAYSTGTQRPQGPGRIYQQLLAYNRLQGIDMSPEALLRKDLKKVLSQWIQNDERIVLCIDCNESIVSGGMSSMLVDELGLVERSHDFWQGEPPHTFVRGSDPIDGLFTTDDVDITAYMMLSFHESPGDHRAYIFEITSLSMFGEFSYKIQRGNARRLTMANERAVRSYNSIKMEQFKRHNIEQRQCELRILSEASSAGLSDELKRKWQLLHKQVDEIHIHAEKRCRDLKFPPMPWSEPVSYWAERRRAYKELLSILKRGVKGNISNAVRKAKRYGIDLPKDLTINQIEEAITYCSQRMTCLHVHASGLRRVTQRNQLIAAEIAGDEQKINRLKQIQSRESTRRAWRRIKVATKDFTNLTVTETKQTVNGVVQTCVTEEDVVASMQAETSTRFTSAYSAPICQSEVASSLSYFSSDTVPSGLLDGSIPIPNDVDWATKLTLMEIITLSQTIKSSGKLLFSDSITYTEDDFRHQWSSKREMTSSSPSSIHIGHYLAALREPSFVSFYSTYWTDILRFKVPPDRWFVGLQVALLKEPGNFAVGRLRFIQLYEADFNSLDKWLAHKITSTLTELDLVPEEHFAKKECTVVDANMDKTLTFDLSRVSRVPMTNVSVDAANCFDRINHNILSLLWYAVTGDWALVTMFLSVIGQMELFQRTGFGDSKTSVGGRDNPRPFQGKGQGSGGAPGAWLHHSSMSILAYLRRGFGSEFVNPVTSTTFGSMGRLFVDDTNLFNTLDVTEYSSVDSDELRTDLLEETQRSVDCWGSLLCAGGGTAKKEKCYWQPVFYEVNQGVWHYQDAEEVDFETTVPQPDGTNVPIKKLALDEAPKELGVAETVTGGSQAQLDRMKTKFSVFTGKIRNVHEAHAYAWLAYRLQIGPGIMYSIGSLTNDMEEIDELFEPSNYKLLPTLSVVRSIRKVLRTLPQTFGGVGLWHMPTEQLIARLNLLLQHYAMDSLLGDKFRAMTCWLQLEIGTDLSPFALPYEKWSSLATQSWHKMLWRTLCWSGVEVYLHSVEIPLPRVNDDTIMAFAMQHGVVGVDLVRLNRCRLWLNLLFLSDIITADGAHWEQSLVGDSPISIASAYTFPPARPTPTDWKVWTTFWNSVSGPSRSSERVLGPWMHPTHRLWRWFYAEETDQLQLVDGTKLHIYSRRGTTSTRSQRSQFIQTSTVDAPPTGTPASVQPMLTAGSSVSLVNTGPILALTPTTRWSTFWCFLADWGGTWMWRNVSHSHIEADLAWLVKAIISNTAIWSTDGSHDRIRAPDISGAGWIVYDTVSHHKLRGQFFERSNRAGSHRGEMVGSLALHLLCLALEAFFEIPASSNKFLCDNESSLNEARLRRKRVPTKRKSGDVIRHLRWIKSKLRMTFSYEDVTAHGDDNLPFVQLPLEQQLNCLCDESAKAAVTEAITLGDSLSGSFLFPKEQIAVHVDGWKQTTDVERDVKFTTGRVEARKRLTVSYKVGSEVKPPPLSSSQFDEIDWLALDRALASKGDVYRCWLTKQNSNFCGSRVQVSRYEGNPAALTGSAFAADKCPNCDMPGERASHLCVCPDPGRTKLFQDQVAELDEWMHGNFHPELAYFIPKYLLFRGTKDMADLGIMSPEMTKVAMSQDLVGWRKFTEGRLSKNIITMQQSHAAVTSSQHNGASWVQQLIRRIVHITHSQWIYRNVSLHHSRDSDRSDDLIAEIHQILDMPEKDLPADSRYLLDVDSDALRNGSVDAQEKFVYVARAAIKAGQRVRSGRALERRRAQRRLTTRQMLGIDEAQRQLRLTETPYSVLTRQGLPPKTRRRPHPSSAFATLASNKRLCKPD